jgi:hypothetical protein
MAFSEQGLLLASTGNRLFAFDPYSGALIWQSPVLLSNLRSSIQLGAEALFLSHGGRTVVRRSLQTGKVEAESPVLPGAGPGSLVTLLDRDRLFAVTGLGLFALDAGTMKLVWRGMTDRNANLQAYMVGWPYVVAVDRQRTPAQRRQAYRHVAYFYDRRDDSGIIPADGGAADLGGCDFPQGIHFADDTILIVDGPVIHGWTGPQK